MEQSENPQEPQNAEDAHDPHESGLVLPIFFPRHIFLNAQDYPSNAAENQDEFKKGPQFLEVLQPFVNEFQQKLDDVDDCKNAFKHMSDQRITFALCFHDANVDGIQENHDSDAQIEIRRRNGFVSQTSECEMLASRCH